MLGCRHLRLLAAPLLTLGTSSSAQTPSGRRSCPLSHIYEDNLAERGDKRSLHSKMYPSRMCKGQTRKGVTLRLHLLFIFNCCFAVEQTFFSCISSGSFISRWWMKCLVWHLSLTAWTDPLESQISFTKETLSTQKLSPTSVQESERER